MTLSLRKRELKPKNAAEGAVSGACLFLFCSLMHQDDSHPTSTSSLNELHQPPPLILYFTRTDIFLGRIARPALSARQALRRGAEEETTEEERSLRRRRRRRRTRSSGREKH